MAGYETGDFANSDEIREFGNGKAEMLNMSKGTVGRLVLSRVGAGRPT
jgi:hypothetical protein